jgi:hypothetical protein
MIMATAKSMYVKWIHEGKVYTGDFCTAQGECRCLCISFGDSSDTFTAGIVQQLGDTGSALATLVRVSIVVDPCQTDLIMLLPRPSPSTLL